MRYEVRLEAEVRVSATAVVTADSDTEAVDVAVASRGNLEWELGDVPTRHDILRFTPLRG